MRNPVFREFEHDLLSAGVAPRHVFRTVTELNEHLDDLVDEAVAAGADPEAARQSAVRELGDLDCIASAVRAQPENEFADC